MQRGGGYNTEVAFALLTQQRQVQFQEFFPIIIEVAEIKCVTSQSVEKIEYVDWTI